MIPFIIGAVSLIAYGLFDENSKPKTFKRMAKGGGVNSFDKIFAEYEDNEDNNYHSENVVLLAKNFGSAEDLKLAKSILKKHESEGSLSGEIGKQRYALHQKLYSKLIASKPKMANGGGVSDECYIEYMNKDKGFQKDIKKFKSYESAVKWGKKNFERFNYDMIKYKK